MKKNAVLEEAVVYMEKRKIHCWEDNTLLEGRGGFCYKKANQHNAACEDKAALDNVNGKGSRIITEDKAV